MCSQQLSYQEQLLSCVDKSAWKLNDKDWVKARKVQWSELSKKLKARNETTLPLLQNKTINYWKSYFLSCELASTEHLISFRDLEINPFFIMWFHPDQSEENIRTTYNNLLGLGEWVRDKISRYFFNDIFYNYYDGLTRKECFGEEGVFYRKDNLYVRLVIGNKDRGYSIQSQSLDYFISHLIFYFLSSNTSKVDLDWPLLKIVDYFIARSDKCSPTDVEWKVHKRRIVLQFIYYFDELIPYLNQEQQFQKNAKEVVVALKQALENKELPEKYQHDWVLVKETLKKSILSEKDANLPTLYHYYEKLIKSISR